MTVITRPVQSKLELKKFINFPFKLYRNNPYWVPPFKKGLYETLSQNPAQDVCETELWLAYEDGKIVGRIAGIINHRHNVYTGKQQARFGWLDFIDNPEVSEELLATVEHWSRERGAKSLHGPLGFNDLDNSGMLVEGFDELATAVTFYNYPYYPEHLEKLGYVKEVDWIEYKILAPKEIPRKIDVMAKRVARQLKLHNLKISSKDVLMSHVREMFDLFQKTYKVLYGFVPLTEAQIERVVKQNFSFVDPKYIALIADKADKVVAFGITMPSLSKALQRARGGLFPFGWYHLKKALNNCKVVDFYLIGVDPELQGKGVTALILHQLGHTFIETGIQYAESNPELEDNARVQTQWKFFERRQHKRRRVYVKNLGD